MKRILLTCSAAALAALTFPATPSLAGDAPGPWRHDRPITVAHRGAPLQADENTMAAFKEAYRRGLDVFECDPRLTKDGVYVIMHDSRVDRTTDGEGMVADMTYDEVKKLRTASGHPVPTLREALQFARDHDMGVYLDIKEPPADGGRKLVGLIEETGMTGRVIVGCYHLKTVKMIERANPELSTCVSWPYPASTMWQAKRLGADAIGTLRGLATPRAIKKAHKKGLCLITMPINDEDEMRKLIERGLDGVQSDDPELLNKLLPPAETEGAAGEK